MHGLFKINIRNSLKSFFSPFAVVFLPCLTSSGFIPPWSSRAICPGWITRPARHPLTQNTMEVSVESPHHNPVTFYLASNRLAVPSSSKSHDWWPHYGACMLLTLNRFTVVMNHASGWYTQALNICGWGQWGFKSPSLGQWCSACADVRLRFLTGVKSFAVMQQLRVWTYFV